MIDIDTLKKLVAVAEEQGATHVRTKFKKLVFVRRIDGPAGHSPIYEPLFSTLNDAE